jgi:hypothetical protein
MEILETIKEHNVTDYDFVMASGAKLAITVDHDAGDTVQDYTDRYVITTVEKPSLTDPDKRIESSIMDVYKHQIAVLARHNRKQRLPTLEEAATSKKLIHRLAKGIQ